MNLQLLDEQGVAVDIVMCRICSKPVLRDLYVLSSGTAVHQLCLGRLRGTSPVVRCPLRRDVERQERLSRLWNSDISIFMLMAMMD